MIANVINKTMPYGRADLNPEKQNKTLTLLALEINILFYRNRKPYTFVRRFILNNNYIQTGKNITSEGRCWLFSDERQF